MFKSQKLSKIDGNHHKFCTGKILQINMDNESSALKIKNCFKKFLQNLFLKINALTKTNFVEFILRIWSPNKILWNLFLRIEEQLRIETLHKICKDTGFHWRAFSRILAYCMQCNTKWTLKFVSSMYCQLIDTNFHILEI